MATLATAADNRRRSPGAIERCLGSEYLVLALSVAWFVAVLPFSPEFSSATNLLNLLAALLPLLVLATGQTLVLVSGGIDLSITSTIAMASVAGGWIMQSNGGAFGHSGFAVPTGVAAMLAVGALVGACNGVAIAFARMPAFIVTLTSMMFVSGFAVWLTKSQPIGGLPAMFNAIGGGLPTALAVTAAVAVFGHLLLARTIFGRWIQTIGYNTRTATVSGVPVRGTTIAVYVLSGMCAAIASVLYTGRLETASPILGQRLLLDVIGATVIGGTSLFGGKGKIMWTLFGAVFFTLIDNSLNLLNLSYFAIMMVKGAVILIAALLDTLRRPPGFVA